MVWYSKNSAGMWDAYIGNADCQGDRCCPQYAGNRGPADMTSEAGMSCSRRPSAGTGAPVLTRARLPERDPAV